MPRRGGLGFSLFGFPVRIHLSFLAIALLIGLSGPDPTLTRALVWIAVVLVSVLVHELGHAFAARVIGAEPTIDLYALGGLTVFTPPRPLGRLPSIGISLAGPFAGFLLGALVLSGAAVFGVGRASPFAGAGAPVAEIVIGATIWVNLYWGFVNLLPILPLDGGNVLQNLLPGSELTRDRWATILSLGVSAALVFVLVQTVFAGLVLLPLLLGFINAQALVSAVRNRTPGRDDRAVAALAGLDRGDAPAMGELVELAERLPAAGRDRLKAEIVEILARRGRVPEAREALERVPGQAHPALYALVDAVSGVPHGVAMLDEMVAAEPEPWLARYAVVARLLTHRGGDVPAAFLALPRHLQSPELLGEAQYVAHLQQDFPAAVAIGELTLRLGSAPDPWVLYNTACSLARLGHHDRALAHLRQAVDAGWDDAAHLDADQDLAPLWVSVDFREIRRRLALAPSLQ